MSRNSLPGRTTNCTPQLSFHAPANAADAMNPSIPQDERTF
jgi:hypothetical protein